MKRNYVLENYLSELTRWKEKMRELDDVEIANIKKKLRTSKNPEEIKKLKFKLQRLTSPESIQKLKQSGVAKSAEEFRSGVGKGTEKMREKYGAIKKRSFFRPPSTGPSWTDKGKYNIYDPISWKGGNVGRTMGVKSRDEWKKLKPYIDRHEAEEARHLAILRKKYKSLPTTSTVVTDILGRPVGHHKSLGVLKREKELTDYASKLYGDAGAIRRYRSQSGEYDIVKGKSYKDIGKLDKQAAKTQITRLRKALLDKFGGDRRKALAWLKSHKKLKKFGFHHGKQLVKGLKIGGAATVAAGLGYGGYKYYKNRKEAEKLAKKKGK